VYYRCQVITCPTTCIREDALDSVVAATLRQIALPEEEIDNVGREIENAERNVSETREASRAQLTGQLGHVNGQLERLTDAYIDGKIDKELHNERRGTLLAERQKATEALANLEADLARGAQFFVQCLQLARNPETLYLSAEPSEKRRLLSVMTSNRTANGKQVEIAIAEPFRLLPKVQETPACALDRGWNSNRKMWRNPSEIAATLLAWAWAAENSSALEELGEKLLVKDAEGDSPLPLAA
jgi:hypothetical protein